MECFDKAGFRLGPVDRDNSPRYPAGRLELLPLCKLTHGKNKFEPIPKTLWPKIDFSEIDVAKCLPAWYPYLMANGFNYWIALTRNSDFEVLGYPHDIHIRVGKWDGDVSMFKEVLKR